MSLPNLASTVLSFAQTITKRTVTQIVVNHKPVKSYVNSDFLATVTTPKTEDLQQVEIDTSLKYKNIHTVAEIKMDDLFIHKGTNYKIIVLADREDYGYYKALGEEIQL